MKDKLKAIKNISSLVQISVDNSHYLLLNHTKQINEISDAALIFDETIHWVGAINELDKVIKQNNYYNQYY